VSELSTRTAGGRRDTLTGVGIGTRAVDGPVVRMGDPLPEPPADPRTTDLAAELALVRRALAGVAADLRRRAGIADGEVAEVVEAQAMIAEDPVLADEIAAAVSQGARASRAAYDAFGRYREALASAGPYLAARVADLDDVRQRVVAACLGVPVPGVPRPGHPFVLVARDLSPADTAVLDPATVLAIVTEDGGPTSHTAVLARARGIPAVVGCTGATGLADGVRVLVDPASSRVVRNPDPAVVRDAVAASRTAGTIGPGQTADGCPIALLANVGGPGDVPAALDAGAEGVGLYRTELLFLDADRAPEQDEQVDAYRRVFEAFGPGQRVVIRVLDAGADKPLRFLDPVPEPNPALGVRGLRALRVHPDVLAAQLDAIATAADGAACDVWLMAPMVSEPEEAEWFAAQAADHGLATAGVMVEVPSAALLAEEILAVAKFASIGTNDLAQYTLAVDRQARGLARLQDPWHPGMLRLVREVGRAGTRLGKPIGVCGEAAADPLLARVLVGLGVTSLSMAPSALAGVRDSLARFTVDDCRRLAEQVTATASAAEARRVAAATHLPRQA
jgi:phosphoenolpyruvate-protein phosphotransferase (PTS system enzyme I)